VTEPGVGTNRYAYANNDPVNKLDPNGNFFGLIAGFIAQALGVKSVLAIAAIGVDSAVALANGASLGDVVKSATIQFAMTMMMIPGDQSAGVFRNAGGVDGGGLGVSNLSDGMTHEQILVEEMAENSRFTTDTSTEIFTQTGRRVEYDLSFQSFDGYGRPRYILADVKMGLQLDTVNNIEQISVINEFKKYGAFDAQGIRIPGTSDFVNRNTVGIIGARDTSGVGGFGRVYANMLHVNGISFVGFPGRVSRYLPLTRVSSSLLAEGYIGP